MTPSPILTPTCCATISGAIVDMRYPSACPDGQLSLLDIAQSLAETNRYNGHCSRPLSVAEHSLLVCDILEREFAINRPGPLLAALLHDAHEAYTGDCPAPVKRALGSTWRDFEQGWADRVLTRFGVLRLARQFSSLIRHSDVMALATETRDLRPAAPQISDPAPLGWVNLADGAREAMSWQDWREAFLERFSELHTAYQIEREEAAEAAQQALAKAAA